VSISFQNFWESGRVKASGEGCSEMKTSEKQTYCSVEELLGGCANSDLKSLVSSVLENNRYIAWSLASCSVDGDTLRSEFTSPTGNSGLVFHLSCEKDASGERGHISTSVPS
jgi:hypothetical protein